MALFALAEATGRDFSIPINRGLQWITGKNELKCELRDALVNAVWSGIFSKTKYHGYLSELLAYCGLSSDGVPPRVLSIKQECCPHNFGWLLYTFAPCVVRFQQNSMGMITRAGNAEWIAG